MLFREIIGHQKTKERLIQGVLEGRVSHAQLFLGSEGSGALPLALAYAQFISCENKSEADSCGTCISCKQFSKLIFPDLHFLYPQNITKKMEEKGRGQFLTLWRESCLANPYLSLTDWYDKLDLENKQGIIYSEDINELIQKLSLKAFGTGYKISIVWFPEKMDPKTSNKMLKILEEPPSKTLFIFVSENSDALLPTIKSRLQLIKVPRLNDDEMFSYFADELKIEYHKAKSLAHLSEGNFNEAVKMMEGQSNAQEIMKVRDWFLLCFQNRTTEIINWIEVEAKAGRENQKNFLLHCIHVVRESFLISCGCTELVRLEGEELLFAQKLSKLIHAGNTEQLVSKLSRSYYHIERNANPKALFLDLSFDIGRLLQVKL